jgi:hypothetical protein
MVEQLDTVAKAQGQVRVRNVSPTVNVEVLEKALRAFSQGATKGDQGEKPGVPQADPPAEPQQETP